MKQSTCRECGGVIPTETKRTVYCSDECARDGMKTYCAVNGEVRRARTAAWRAANPDAVKAYTASRADVVNARSAEWAAANPDRARARKQRRRARQVKATVERFTSAEIFERDGWVCQICGDPIDQALSWPHPFSVSLDHVVPLKRHGEHSRANTQAAHLCCNISKGTKILPDRQGTLGRGLSS